MSTGDFYYKEVRNDIIELLDAHLEDERKLVEKINKITEREKSGFLRDIIRLITHLDFKEKEAEMHWENIVDHMSVIEKAVNRQVGLRVAMFDYFKNIKGHLKNPKFIEIAEYDETVMSSLLDPLTGLFNRRYLQRFLEAEIKRSKRYKLVFSILMLDIDNFKTYNDTYGHLTGDEALQEIASLLKKESRGEDAVIRYGGEEFIINMPQTDKDGAKIMSERLRNRIGEASFDFGKKGIDVHLTVSGGISSYPVDSEDPKQLIELSDKALYRAKALGKNKIY